jgi:hypothetical protein
MKKPVIFLGPTLPVKEAVKILDAVYLPPAAQGDILTAYKTYSPSVIGLIDGYFECVPSVWHKEILYVMSQGVHIFGSSSMGALRAAELHPFGMTGSGEVFEAYRTGMIEDDDEVAVVHGPESVGYPLLSEAMINIRRSLRDALEEGIITEEQHQKLISAGKDMHYKQRTYQNILQAAGISGQSGSRFLTWLSMNRRDLKKEDAVGLLDLLRNYPAASAGPKKISYQFNNTAMWVKLLDSLDDDHANKKVAS